jgi:hypothetical protein
LINQGREQLNKDSYAVINNPTKIWNKFEVWYAGEMSDVSATGYTFTRNVVTPIKAFRTEQEAAEYIRYQKEIREFKEQSSGIISTSSQP